MPFEQTLIQALSFLSITLLGLATYFLRGIHVDIRTMKEELISQSKMQAIMDQKLTDLDKRVERLESHK